MISDFFNRESKQGSWKNHVSTEVLTKKLKKKPLQIKKNHLKIFRASELRIFNEKLKDVYGSDSIFDLKSGKFYNPECC